MKLKSPRQHSPSGIQRVILNAETYLFLDHAVFRLTYYIDSCSLGDLHSGQFQKDKLGNSNLQVIPVRISVDCCIQKWRTHVIASSLILPIPKFYMIFQDKMISHKQLKTIPSEWNYTQKFQLVNFDHPLIMEMVICHHSMGFG